MIPIDSFLEYKNVIEMKVSARVSAPARLVGAYSAIGVVISLRSFLYAAPIEGEG